MRLRRHTKVQVDGSTVHVQGFVQFIVLASNINAICIKDESVLVELLSLFEAVVALVLEVFGHLYSEEKVVGKMVGDQSSGLFASR